MVRLTKDVGCGLTVSVEGELFTEAFEKMSMIEDVFETPENIKQFKCRTRVVEDNTYYELYDPKTKAKLGLGQYKKPKDGWLFPKRKDKDGNWLNNRGWEVYQPANAATQTTKPASKPAGKSKKDEDIPI